MLRSLRSRLLAGMIASTALLVALFGLLVYVAIRRALVAEFDSSLAVAARTLAASVEIDDGEFELEFDPRGVGELHPGRRPLLFQFWSTAGAVLKRSESLGQRDLPKFHGPEGQPACRFVPLDQAAPLRAAGIRFVPRADEDDEDDSGPLRRPRGQGRPRRRETSRDSPALVLVVARDFSGMAARLARLRWLLLGAGAGTMVAALLVSFVLVGRSLRPMTALARRIADIREETLAQPLREGRLPTEMLPVVRRLNGLLERLEGAFRRERAFTADVAHELRTPLAGLRSVLEVALADRADAADPREALADCLEIALAMQAMVERLLMLARLDRGQAASQPEALRPAGLVEDCWAPLAERSRRKEQAFANGVAGDAAVLADRDTLAMVLANLLENAVEYAPRGGRIRATSRAIDDAVEIAVSSTGCTLSDQQVSQVFDRFWRADPARKDTGLHCGLGLALVRRAAESLGGQALADVDAEGLFTVRLHLPRPPCAEGRHGQASA